MAPSNPLVSVVVTCYNHEDYIQECLLSILKQTYTNIELIVVDDGSKDNSAKVIQSLQNDYTFTYKYQKNQGVCAALNHGVTQAKGEYICCCDSDDKFALNKIEKQLNFMLENPQYKVSYTNKIFFNNEGEYRPENSGKRRSGWLFEPLIMSEFSIPFSSHMLHKEVYQKIGLYDLETKLQDWDMFLRIAKEYEIGFLNEDLLYYRIHDSNLHSNVDLMLNAKYQHLEKWKDDPIYPKAKQKLDFHFFNDFAKIDKKRALSMLPTVIPYFDKRIFKGIRRLLLKW